MNAEIVVTGSELLLGETLDTNSKMMARMLRDIGLDLYYITTVGDNRERMAAVLSLALNRADFVITSGGLGPTVDDVTREAVSDATGRPLVFHQELLDQIAARFARFGRPMTENNRRQAMIPKGATAIYNPVGTAPAFAVEDVRGTIVSLPGVPSELEYLMQNEVIPYLRQRLGPAAIIWPKILRTCNIGESQIDALIGDLMTGANPTIGLAAHSGQVDVRITAKAASQIEADRLIAPVEAEIRARLRDTIYGEGTQTVEEVVSLLMNQQGETLALLDAVPGGLLVGQRLRETPHAQVVKDNRHYVDTQTAAASLGLESSLCSDEVSCQHLAREMALRLRGEAQTSLSLVALAEPNAMEGEGSSEERSKVFLSLSDGTKTVSRSYRFNREDNLIRRWLDIRTLDLIRRHLIKALD